MQWYTANCVFRSAIAGGAKKQLWEHRYFLLRADDEKVAEAVAKKLAESKQHNYVSAEGKKVRWIFDRLIAVKEVVGELAEGTEVYHEYFSPSLKSNQKSKAK